MTVVALVHSNAEHRSEVYSCSSPLAVNRYSEERMSMRSLAKVKYYSHIILLEQRTSYLHFCTFAHDGNYI